MRSSGYFTRIYEDVLGVILKFLKGKSGRERSRCKHSSCIAERVHFGGNEKLSRVRYFQITLEIMI